MKGKILFGALVMSAALATQGFAGELMDRMLGLGNGGCGCAQPACCEKVGCGPQACPAPCAPACNDVCAPRGKRCELFGGLRGLFECKSCCGAPSCGPCEPACKVACPAPCAPAKACKVACPAPCAPACPAPCAPARHCKVACAPACEKVACAPCAPACEQVCEQPCERVVWRPKPLKGVKSLLDNLFCFHTVARCSTSECGVVCGDAGCGSCGTAPATIAPAPVAPKAAPAPKALPPAPKKDASASLYPAQASRNIVRN